MASSTTSLHTTPSSKGRITLSGAQETLLATLFARADDAELARPVLNDRLSAQIATAIRTEHGYDYNGRIDPISRRVLAHTVAARAKLFDQTAERFLRDHPGPATVLHLACGLDTRCHRVQWQGEGRLWIDADKEDVVRLRRQVVADPVVPAGAGEYRLVDPDIVRDADWLGDIRVPTDRPVMVMFEGLVMYLNADEVRGLFRRLVRHFDGSGVPGDVHFDSLGWLGYFMLNYVVPRPLARMGTRFSFYMSGPAWLEGEVPGLRFWELQSQLLSYLRKDGQSWLFGGLAWLVEKMPLSALVGAIYSYKF